MLIIHEYGEPSHYIGAIKSRENINEEVKFLEFSTTRLVVKAMRNHDHKRFFKALGDFLLLLIYFIFPFLLKNRKVILGMAPLDMRVFFMARLLKYANVTYHSSWLIWDGSKFPKKTVFLSNLFQKKWRKFLGDEVNSFAVVTESVKDELVKYMGVNPASIEVVYHAYDENIFTEKPRVRDPKHQLVVLYIGRLVESKGISDILELSRRNSQYMFYFIGKGALDKSIRLAEKTQTNVQLLGYINDKNKIAEYCNISDVILLPSKRNKNWEELFGMALIEAMACGCIPICTDHGGPKTIMSGQQWGDNIFKEDLYIEGACKLLEKYASDPFLLDEYRQMAKMTAASYGKESISKVWDKVL
jgi:glycosyltransferase involved in cell wall biosynthesis